MGQASLVAQLHALVHAEPVLLVDDGQRQPMELDTRLEQSVRAHDDEVTAFRHRRQPRTAFRRTLAAGDEPHIDAKRRQPLAQGLEMLLGEDLGGCHDRGLIAVFGRANRGKRSHDRLA